MTDADGNPIVIAEPGNPTKEEATQFAQALKLKREGSPLTAEQQERAATALKQRMALFPHLYNRW